MKIVKTVAIIEIPKESTNKFLVDLDVATKCIWEVKKSYNQYINQEIINHNNITKRHKIYNIFYEYSSSLKKEVTTEYKNLIILYSNKTCSILLLNSFMEMVYRDIMIDISSTIDEVLMHIGKYYMNEKNY